MCSGRVDLAHVIRAFENGMDGVYLGGCRLNECNYITHGNYDALAMVLLARRILKHIGLHPERLRIEFMSSADGILFIEGVNDFVRTVKALGPLGRSEGLTPGEVAARLAEVQKLVPWIKLAKREKLAARLTDPAGREGHFTAEEVADLFREVPAYYIDPQKCQACRICAGRCPVEAIDGGKQRVHVIDQERCIKCGTCLAVCPERFQAVTCFVGVPPPPPPAEDRRAPVRRKKAAAAP